MTEPIGMTLVSDQELARLRAEVERLTRELEDWKAIGKGMNRLAGVVSRIAGTLGLDPDESEEEEVEQRAKALRTLVRQLAAALREIEARSRWPMTPAVHTWITDTAHAAVAAAAPYLS